VLLQPLLAIALIAIFGCSQSPGGTMSGNGGANGDGGQGQTPGFTVEVGTPGGQDGLDFAPLAKGAELRLQTFGQGGTHVLIGVRCTGFGSRAFVSAKLRNLTTGVEIAEPAPARPQLLYCDDQNVCDLVPYLVHTSGITESEEERDGLRVFIIASVESEAGDKAHGSVEVVLSAADL
jgi:hypothetical protein